MLEYSKVTQDKTYRPTELDMARMTEFLITEALIGTPYHPNVVLR